MTRARQSFSSPALAPALAFALGLAALGCSSGPISVGDDRSTDAGVTAPGAPEPEELLALLGSCTQISDGLLARAPGRTKEIAVCGLTGAVFWRSGLAVDCDGKRSDVCNEETDPQSTDKTVGKDSNGDSLDPAVVPYIEIPKASAVFDYASADLAMGSVVAVVYKDQLKYGILGTEQAADVIGAASVAMTAQLGINADPMVGGVSTKDVSYVAFTGASNVVPALEDVAAARALAQRATRALIDAQP